MNFPNPVRQKIMAGQPSFGSFLNLVSPMAAEVLVDLGYEWLAVDAEHAQWDIGSMTNAFRAIEARGGIPMTRVESHDPTVLARTLDAGAMGVIVPHVSTAEQAKVPLSYNTHASLVRTINPVESHVFPVTVQQSHRCIETRQIWSTHLDHHHQGGTSMFFR